MDLSGNIATEVINITVDSRAPAPADLSKVSITAPVAGQVSITGSVGAVEPGATVQFTNMATGAVTSVDADAATGVFDQLVSANPGDVVRISVFDAAGNSAGPIAYTVGATVQIVTPVQSQNIGSPTVDVSGLFSDTANSGVSVNGEPGCEYSNTFYVNKVLLQTDSKTLTATLTAVAGSDQDSVTVTRAGSGPAVKFDADSDCGIAPLDVKLDVVTALPILQMEIDFDGDGVIDYSSTDANAPVNTTYSVPGVYTATVWVLDQSGVEYRESLNIVVQDEAQQDNRLQQVWSNFVAALASGDVNTALQSFKSQSRGFYGPVLRALAPNLGTIAGDLSGIEKIRIGEDFAEYAVLTVVSGQVRAFVVTFIRDSDGAWRILSI